MTNIIIVLRKMNAVRFMYPVLRFQPGLDYVN